MSVGETLAITPSSAPLKAERPELPILLTTTTRTGAEQAAKLGIWWCTAMPSRLSLGRLGVSEHRQAPRPLGDGDRAVAELAGGLRGTPPAGDHPQCPPLGAILSSAMVASRVPSMP